MRVDNLRDMGYDSSVQARVRGSFIIRAGLTQISFVNSASRLCGRNASAGLDNWPNTQARGFVIGPKG